MWFLAFFISSLVGFIEWLYTCFLQVGQKWYTTSYWTTSDEGSVVTIDSGMYFLDIWLLCCWFMMITAISINYDQLSVSEHFKGHGIVHFP
jgi:hypothetical protein